MTRIKNMHEMILCNNANIRQKIIKKQ